MEHVAVLGDGSMGTTIATVVAGEGRRCILWCPNGPVARAIHNERRHPYHFPAKDLPPELSPTDDLGEAVGGASLLVLATASRQVRETARAVADVATTPPPFVLSATKGIELPGCRRMSEVLAEELPGSAIGVISGPNVTPDIMAGQLTAIVVASRNPELLRASAGALQSPRLKVYGNGDVVGVESAGIFKNAIAIAMGIATGLDWGANTRSFLFTRGLGEIRQLSLALGGAPSTFYGLAGIGDLFLTSTSPHSLNYRLGIELARDKSLADILAGLPELPEGVSSTRGTCVLAERLGVPVPLAQRTREIMDGERPPSTLEEPLASLESGGVDFDAFC